MKRDKTVKIRCYDSELNEIKRRCPDGETVAAWCRNLALGEPIQPSKPAHRAPPRVDPDLIRQLSPLGNNVNQIARTLNQLLLDEEVKFGVDAIYLTQEISAILFAVELQLQQLLTTYSPALAPLIVEEGDDGH